MKPLRLLTIGHSYVVAQNRRLAHTLAAFGSGRWEVTAAAPRTLPGDLREIELEPIPGEACRLESLDMHFPNSAHWRIYDGGLRALMREKWDVVHCWEEPYVAAGAQVAALAPGQARLVPATFQNIAKTYPPPFGWFERRVMKRSDGWIAFGRSAADAMAAKPSFAGKPSRVIPPGVDIGSFKPNPAARAAIRQQLGWSEDARVVGYLGRFVPQKGIHVLLDAFRSAREKWHALFVGGGPLLGDIERLQGSFPDRVRIATDVAHDDVPSYLNAMDVLCAPSQTTDGWREQFGRMLIEGMACGVPIVASTSGEIPAVVGDAGVLVAEDDTAAWSAAISRLLSDEGSRYALAARGLERVRGRFTWAAVARAHLDFFEELMELPR
jgi:glycosyltransferase involved in cell wall biosynthesis